MSAASPTRRRHRPLVVLKPHFLAPPEAAVEVRELRRRVLASAAAVLSCTALLSGCSFSVSITTPAVDKADLQNDLASKFEYAGKTPQSVSCSDDLEGVVGRTVRCTVTLNATDAAEVVVEVTEVDGTTVSYMLIPVFPQAQLEKAVLDLVTRNSTSSVVESVTCGSGLEGRKGNEAYCAVKVDGVLIPSTVTVSKVDGLSIDFTVTPN